MAVAKNKVIAGDYEGRGVTSFMNEASIVISSQNIIYINKNTVSSHELVTEEHRKSAASGVTRGLVGGFLLGGVGAFAGGLSAKNKGIYQIAIEFKSGQRSLLEVDDKIYKAIIKCCF